ncbi:MAG: hypothetical protein LW884_02035 [Bacteroidetes bacterium]|jgi:hypothetical protein|nr:hypothetical protein [Bacteroidota bacterium]
MPAQAQQRRVSPEILAIRQYAAQLDTRIDSASQGVGLHQMVVTLEAETDEEDYLKRLVNFAHEPFSRQDKASNKLNRVTVNYLEGDSTHIQEVYYYQGKEVVCARKTVEGRKCQGEAYYFRKYILIQADYWDSRACDGPRRERLVPAKHLDDNMIRKGMHHQLRGREYQAAFSSFSYTLLRED